MLTLAECRKYIKNEDISDERLLEIRDFLYAISNEIAVNCLNKFEHKVKMQSKEMCNTVKYEQT